MTASEHAAAVERILARRHLPEGSTTDILVKEVLILRERLAVADELEQKVEELEARWRQHMNFCLGPPA
jgi:hypothetical protein